jgi:hypothetical protein
MADQLTPNLGLIKPDVGGSDDTWGEKLNSNFDKLDTAAGLPPAIPPEYITDAELAVTLDGYISDAELATILGGYVSDAEFPEGVDDRVAALLKAGTNITLDYNDAANSLTINSTGGGSGGGASVTISTTPPASPTAGNMWWESDTGLLYIYYNDGDSSQWVVVLGGGGGGGIADAPITGLTYARQNAAWTQVVTYVDTVKHTGNGNVIGGPNAGGALTASINNVLIGKDAGRFVTSGAGVNVVIGPDTGKAMTTGTQNTIIGAGAGQLITGDTGHTLVGYNAGLALNSNGITWNTFVGHSAGQLFTTGGSSVAIGRAAAAHETTGAYITAIGHAAYFNGINGYNVTAIGDVSGGAPVDGTGTNWQSSGLLYYGSIDDIDCNYIGGKSGKATAPGRTNANAFGNMARIPARDNVMVLGHGLKVVETAGRFWDAYSRTDISQNTATVITIAQMMAGLIVRGGTPGGPLTDTTDTAANIVAGGPGQYCEVPCSMEISISNLLSAAAVLTLAAGTGVSISGLGGGGTIAGNATGRFRVVVINSTPGSEAVTLYRVG